MSESRLVVASNQPCGKQLAAGQAHNTAYVYHRASIYGRVESERVGLSLSGRPEIVGEKLTKTRIPETYGPFWVTQVLKRYAAPQRLPHMPIAIAVIRHCYNESHADGVSTPKDHGYKEILSRDLWAPRRSRVQARKDMDPRDPALVKIDDEGVGFVPVTLESGEVLMRRAISLPLTAVERNRVQCIDVIPLAVGSFSPRDTIFALVHVLSVGDDGRRSSIERVHQFSGVLAA